MDKIGLSFDGHFIEKVMEGVERDAQVLCGGKGHGHFQRVERWLNREFTSPRET